MHHWWRQLLIALEKVWPTGTLVAERYRIDCCLGMGSFGVSYEAYDLRSGDVVVVKQQRRHRRFSQKATAAFLHEARVMAQLDDRAFPQLKDELVWRGYRWIVMERMAGKTIEEWLFDHDYKVTEQEALQLMNNVATAVAKLHAVGYVHRDLRIPNVLLDGERVAIIDFGLAKRIGEPVALRDEGERLRRDTTEATDIYSLAHFLLFLLYSTFEAESDVERPWYEELQLTPAVKQMMLKMLQVEGRYDNIAQWRGDLDRLLEGQRDEVVQQLVEKTARLADET